MGKFKTGDIVTGTNENDFIYGMKCEIIEVGEGEVHQRIIDDTDETIAYYAIRTLESKNNTRKGMETLKIWREEDLELVSKNEQTKDTFTLQEIRENTNGFKAGTKFKIVESPLTLDDFDLEEEFEVVGFSGIYKKIEIYGSIFIAQSATNGVKFFTIDLFNEYIGEDNIFIKIN